MNDASIKLDLSMKHPVLYLSGNFIGADPEFISREIEKTPDYQDKKILLDFTNTLYINSSGISLLIRAIQMGNDKKYKVEFCGLSAHFTKIFNLVGLAQLVQIHKHLDDAF